MTVVKPLGTASLTTAANPDRYTPLRQLQINRQTSTDVRSTISASQSRGLILRNLPPRTSINDIYKTFRTFGYPEYIEIFERAPGQPNGRARIRFERPLPNSLFASSVYDFGLPDGTQHCIQIEADKYRAAATVKSPIDSRRLYPERMTVMASSIDFGLMSRPTIFMTKWKGTTKLDSVKFSLSMRFEELTVEFPLVLETRTERFKFTVPFNRMNNIKILPSGGKVLRILFDLEDPPRFFRRIPAFPKDQSKVWGEQDNWFRQTDIVLDPGLLKDLPLTVSKPHAILDIGRWTTYHLKFDMTDAKSLQIEQMQNALNDFNVAFLAMKEVTFEDSVESPFWALVDANMESRLSFEVRYQLEVCISQGVFNEYNLDSDFIKKLKAMDSADAKALLECAAARKTRVFHPMHIFGETQESLSLSATPDYCTLIRSVIVTPTIIKFNTPTVETSNRILRQYSDHCDRFIRVRFTEEGAHSKIFPTEKNNQNEVFTRVKRTFANGIKVGDRTFIFLAFGNSQFREHGAYFFAPVPSLSKYEIRSWMGYFDEIRNPALFAARLGQCFSTTRAVGTNVELVETADIKRNGYCFSDGVGRISPAMAGIIADSLGITRRHPDPPSVFQFRLGGCKGVLAVWPWVEDGTVDIRKTQYKFPALHEGLEIIRYSQFASANLNRQIILVLSTLGVPDDIFIAKMKAQLCEVEDAMLNPITALRILQRDIDHNQMSLKLATMVMDGFQASGEPFIKSLLQLWRAWSIKMLKEKARITIHRGALLIGCLDETGTLKGQFDELPASPPEVFVQLSKGPNDREHILTGPMLLARNPSLHPGDIRVVCGVDVPHLHHLRDCVVLPQTGDRDVASMCSGGDLDGDDFEIIWDPDLLHPQRNHAPMDYRAPPKIELDRSITDNDLANFFIRYMKNDSLPTIAHAHVAHADASPDGVKDPKCLELAALHSKAVDFVKTGQEARMTQDLRPKQYPHFMEKRNQRKTYKSEKVLGKLFDMVERVKFEPSILNAFDRRILDAFVIDVNLESQVARLKKEYDNHMRRILAQHAIQTEFEVWSTFVMQHNHANDYKMQEDMAHISGALKDQFRKQCIEIAKGDDYAHLAPTVAAMYKVTADEVAKAIKEGRQADKMPFISFPWLFQDILGKIAQSKDAKGERRDGPKNTFPSLHPSSGRHEHGRINGSTYKVETAHGSTGPGELLQLDFESNGSVKGTSPHTAAPLPKVLDSVPSNVEKIIDGQMLQSDELRTVEEVNVPLNPNSMTAKLRDLRMVRDSEEDSDSS